MRTERVLLNSRFRCGEAAGRAAPPTRVELTSRNATALASPRPKGLGRKAPAAETARAGWTGYVRRVVRKPRQERSRALVDTLLDATAKLLAKQPLATLTTNRIAEVAGVSVGSLYQYFPNKDSLAGALIERKAARDLEELGAALLADAPKGLAPALRAMTSTVVEIHRRDRALMRALLSLVTPTGRFEAVRALAAQGREGLRGLLETHAAELRDGDHELMSFVVGRALEEVVHAALLERPEFLDDPQLAEELFQLAWRYLARTR